MAKERLALFKGNPVTPVADNIAVPDQMVNLLRIQENALFHNLGTPQYRRLFQVPNRSFLDYERLPLLPFLIPPFFASSESGGIDGTLSDFETFLSLEITGVQRAQ